MIHFNKSTYIILAFVTCFAVNCSTTAKRVGDFQAPNYSSIKFSDKLVVSYLPEAEEEIKDSSVFNETKFLNYFKSRLIEKSIISEKVKETIEIKINNARFRASWSAILFGGLAGFDSIDLILTIKDSKGQVIDRHKIEICYGLGGFLAGQSEYRADYFYKEITDLALRQLDHPMQ